MSLHCSRQLLSTSVSSCRILELRRRKSAAASVLASSLARSMSSSSSSSLSFRLDGSAVASDAAAGRRRASEGSRLAPRKTSSAAVSGRMATPPVSVPVQTVNTRGQLLSLVAPSAPKQSAPRPTSSYACVRFSSTNTGKHGKSDESDESHSADGPYCVGYHQDDDRFQNGKPTIAYAKSMPLSFSAMRHEQILQLSAEGAPEARREALIRNIMAVDSLEYDEAYVVFKKIAHTNRQSMRLQSLPHQLGLFTAIGAGFFSIPLIFDLDTVHWFNEAYVTADVPEPKDLETWLEVGSWSWAWMEPVIGQASFFLLAMQFARSQLINMGISPYANYMQAVRANRLVRMYPQYDANTLALFSKSEKYYSPSDISEAALPGGMKKRAES